MVQARALCPVSEMMSECSLLECSKVLTMEGARIVEEEEELELGDGLSEEKLQEPCYDGE